MPWVLWVTMSLSGTSVSQHSEQFENKKACEDMGRAIVSSADVVSKGLSSVHATYVCRRRDGAAQ